MQRIDAVRLVQPEIMITGISRKRASAFSRCQHLEAVHVGHHQVEQDEVDLLGRRAAPGPRGPKPTATRDGPRARGGAAAGRGCSHCRRRRGCGPAAWTAARRRLARSPAAHERSCAGRGRRHPPPACASPAGEVDDGVELREQLRDSVSSCSKSCRSTAPPSSPRGPRAASRRSRMIGVQRGAQIVTQAILMRPVSRRR